MEQTRVTRLIRHGKAKDVRQLETIIKGFANRRRLLILRWLHIEPGLPIDTISERLNTSYLNAADHLRRMARAGLITKRNEGALIRYSLTVRGKVILGFCKNLK